MVELYPFSLTESASHASANHVSALPTDASAQMVNPNAESPIGIEMMIKQLFQEERQLQKQMFKEFEDRHHVETKKIMTVMIEQHIQILNATILQERTARIQDILDVHKQLKELRDEVRTFNLHSSP